MGERRSRSPDSSRPRPIGLGIHQAVELLLGMFVLLSAVRMPERDLAPVLGLGLVLVVLPVVTVGPLAAFRLLRPGAHRVVDVLLVMMAMVSPFLPLGLDAAAIPVIVLTALALAALTRSTSYVVRRRAPKPVAAEPASPPAWARDLGTAAARARTRLPRQAGRVVGRLKKGGGAAP
ncbi:MAG: hypothetical protein M3066_18590 [Actinomycetota bacterium]|nr:hypothetical protein [Actinomycetota bacterium]